MFALALLLSASLALLPLPFPFLLVVPGRGAPLARSNLRARQLMDGVQDKPSSSDIGASIAIMPNMTNTSLSRSTNSSPEPWSLSLINSAEWRPRANASLMQLHRQAQGASDLTFHVLVLTVGRASIFRLLDSLEYQLSSRDFITVAIHAVDAENGTESGNTRADAVSPEAITARLQRGFACSYFVQRIKLRPGHHYHQIRQMMKGIPGDFVIHSDDDNYYLPDAFLKIREHAVERNTLYVFRLGNCSSSVPYTWRLKHLRIANVDTGNGVIPGWLNDKANWALLYFGDYHYYRNIHKFSINAPVFVDCIIGVYTGSGNQRC